MPADQREGGRASAARPIRIKGKRAVPGAHDTVLRLGKVIVGENHAETLPRAEAFRKIRLAELGRLIEHRHAGTPLGENEVALRYATFAAHHLIDPNHIAQWLDVAMPGLRQSTRDEIIRGTVEDPRRWKAQQAAHWLGLTYAERRACSIRTIGAIDKTKGAIKALAEDAKRQRDRESAEARRRRAGAPERGVYLKNTTSTAAIASQVGVSARTLRARRQEIEDLKILQGFVATYIGGRLCSDGPRQNFSAERIEPRWITFRITSRGRPVTIDANELEPIGKKIARAYMDVMRARMRLTDLLAEEQAQKERELYDPPRKRGRKRGARAG